MRMTKNVKRVMAAAPEIIVKLRKGERIVPLQREYGCAYHVLMAAIFSQVTKKQYQRIVHKHRSAAGKQTGFRPGHETWNKGMKGLRYPGSAATQFKPGQMRGMAARKYKAVGSITVRADRDLTTGLKPRRPRFFRFIKVRDDGPPKARWIPLAQYLWEKTHGPVPPGMFVGHKNNDTMDDGLHNLILVDRRGHMLRLYDRPGVIAKCRARAGKVAKRRHAQNRVAKKWAKMQKREARTVWECPECGAEFQEHVSRCLKCLSGVVMRSDVVPMPESMVREGMERVELVEAAYG